MLTLKNCLYAPQSAVRLICPRQIGATTGCANDGLYSMQERFHLIVNGQTTTIHYDTLSQLPVLFSKPGITSYTAFTKVLLHTTNPNSHTGHPNGYMTK
jgi:hypothetical protein